MTTLIFVTETDASPLIHLNADPAVVAQHLATSLPDVWFNDPPGTYAAAFLCGLGEELTGAWSPRLESTPIFCYGAFGGYEIDIAWNPLTWKQWPADGDGVALPSHAHPEAEKSAEESVYDTATRAATRGVGFVCALLLAGSLMIGTAQAQMYPPYGSPGTPTMSGPFGDSGFGNSTTIYTPPPIGSVPRVPSVYSPVPEPSQGPSNYPCTLPIGCR